ncbi:MAG: TonB-dependent receptor [Filimonas sp.]|nr:TonB-dependent receptor [Filimonas sp.]
MKLLLRIPLLLAFVFGSLISFAQTTEIKGKVTDLKGSPLPFATIKIIQTDLVASSLSDGTFVISVPSGIKEVSLMVSHVGKASMLRLIPASQFGQVHMFSMYDLNLKLKEVEVTGVRKTTGASNSSITFDREAIEQTQALSVANVLNYLPGQTIVKPTVSVQAPQILTMRAALPQNGEDVLNNAFGISVQVDGASVSNAANMQTMNVGRSGLSGAGVTDFQQPETRGSRSLKNGTLYDSYNSLSANNGLDLRQIPAENIESIEVVSGVASARYGDYTTGAIIINRQAGVTPWRVNTRVNDATQNVGLNKGLSLGPKWGAINFSLDYLNSNDDPRNKLKTYNRTSAGFIWSYQNKSAGRFKNTLSFDYSNAIDQTKLDPYDGEERSAKMTNKSFRVSNRSSWTLKLPWLYSISFNANYSGGRQESYEQYFRNSNAVIGVTNAMETGFNEGYFAPGYYTAVKHAIGEPVNAGARLEANSIFHLAKHTTYKLSVGVNYTYSANKGPGILIDVNQPRLPNSGLKNERPRPFYKTPTISNSGIYVENSFKTKLLTRDFNINAGIRGDWQNSFFTVSPRVNANLSLTNRLRWSVAYGIATQAPALSQISPGNTYIDIPVINSYGGSVSNSKYYVYTQVVNLEKLDLHPYKSYTFETGLSYDMKPLHVSLFYFNRVNRDGFSAATTLVPITLPVFNDKPPYQQLDSVKHYNATYNRMVNSAYSRTNGAELMVSTDKIKAIQTSFSFSTSFYYTYSQNKKNTINIPDNPPYDSIAVYGVFANGESKTANVKSTFISTTHIPSLRMAISLTGELFWVNQSEQLPTSIYPVGYLDKAGLFYSLTSEQARSDKYAYLKKVGSNESMSYTPAFVYPNIHLRLSKEIGDILRFSFSAYNVFNIRPTEKTRSGTRYYNGQPSYGAELIFTIK